MKLTSIFLPFAFLSLLAWPTLAQEEEEKEPIFKPLELKSYIYFKIGDFGLADSAQDVWRDEIVDRFEFSSEKTFTVASFDEPSTTFRIGDHTKLTQYLGLRLEGAYFGTTEIQLLDEEGKIYNFERFGFGLNAAITPQYTWKDLTVYAVGGLTWVSTDIEFKKGTTSDSDEDSEFGSLPAGIPSSEFDDDEFNSVIGAGVIYSLGPVLQMGLSYEQWEINEVDVDMISFDIGVRY